jgi:serine/threonine protein kinase
MLVAQNTGGASATRVGYFQAEQPQGIRVVNQQHVGAYELGSLLGSGTVGAVYRARHRETGRAAVVKLLQAESAAEPEVQRRFVREVAIAEKLDHPNIVRHYDCGLCEDQIYYAMELVECGTLKDVLRRRGTLSWREAVAVGIQVCDALGHAHQLGIIHRDLKPANLFLAADGKVKIGDFGLARDLHSHRLTLEGQTVGTCRYMPPEQIAGDAELTGAVDLYALGCLIFEMLAGRPPFDGNTVIQIFEAHLYAEPTPLVSLVRDCPQDLSELVLLLLEKQPEARPVSAAEVQHALSDILQGLPMRLASMTGKAEYVEPTATTFEASGLAEQFRSERPTHTAKWSKWRTLAALGVILAAVVVIAIAAVFLR